jgi:hypothetical protein
MRFACACVRVIVMIFIAYTSCPLFAATPQQVASVNLPVAISIHQAVPSTRHVDLSRPSARLIPAGAVKAAMNIAVSPNPVALVSKGTPTPVDLTTVAKRLR